LHLLQALKEEDKVRRFNFCCGIQNPTENDDDFLTHLTFSDESMFHLRGKVNCHNVRIWDTEAPLAGIEQESDLPKVNVFRAILYTRVFGSLIFVKNTMTGTMYLDMLSE
jgi:hypothetical protein